MRYLVMADIHANVHALDAVLAAARAEGFDRTLVLGDVVGYGAHPNETIDRLVALPDVTSVRGNHDKVAAGLAAPADFTAVARDGANWTIGILTEVHKAYLAGLPTGPVVVSEDIEICHGTPDDEDEYVLDSLDALRALRVCSRPLCLYAHTHVPAAYSLSGSTLGYVETASHEVMSLTPGTTYLVNVGSVGQPRDGDARAAFGILDATARAIRFHRVAYDVAAAEAAIRSAGLPEALAARLGRGR